jgi:hypothetical protein
MATSSWFESMEGVSERLHLYASWFAVSTKEYPLFAEIQSKTETWMVEGRRKPAKVTEEGRRNEFRRR